MGEFAKMIQPHLDAHGIEDLGMLARKVRKEGWHVHPHQLERWMVGYTPMSSNVDIFYICHVLNLDPKKEEAKALSDAGYQDCRNWLDRTGPQTHAQSEEEAD